MLFGASFWDLNMSCYMLMFIFSILKVPNVDISIWYAQRIMGDLIV